MIVVGESEDVPPLSNSNSYVYVARTVDGWFYVGETDNLRARIATHRRNSRFGGKGVAFICQDVPLGGKSTARRVEAAVIRDLWRLGFPLLSLADAAHTNFGSSESS
mmetsp:Transcript_27836/g.40958  ORF Transcript_27836/g.40958 Transcript_27836/m.40958 type:complete len:107 (+) Transcript_27836:1-321(+)